MAGSKIAEKFFVALVMPLKGKDNKITNSVCSLVKTLYVIRNLFEQTCPFMVITIELDLTIIQAIEALLSSGGVFPTAKLYINSSEDEKFSRDSNGSPTVTDYNEIYFEQVIITQCIRGEISSSQGFFNVTLTLINRVFFNMANSYIMSNLKYPTNIKSKDCLTQNYMDYLNTNFAKFTLTPIQFPTTKSSKYKVENTHQFDQLVLDSNVCDLHIPAYIIQHYKPINLPSYWFFDDFLIDDSIDKTGEIYCHWLTFFKADKQFKKVDITKNWDITKKFNILSKEAITDHLNLVQDPKLIDPCIRSINMRYVKSPVETAEIVKFEHTTPKQTLLEDGSTIKVNSVITQNAKPKKAVTPIKFENPEGDKEQKNVYSRATLSYFYTHVTLQEIIFYEFQQCLPGVFQFGEIYNLEGFDVSMDKDRTYLSNGLDKNYTLTPAAIVNVFKLVGEKTQHMESSTYVKFLRVNSSDIEL